MAEAASHVVIVSSCDNERIFREYCHVKFANSKTTPVLSRGQLERILTCLKDPKNANSKMRFYVKKNKMCRITLQDTNEDAVAKKDKDNTLKRVVCYEDFYSVIKGVHENVAGHASSRKTFKAIQDQYALIPREAVEKYCSICSVCRLRVNQRNMNLMKPIRVKKFIKHEKVDVIGPTHDTVKTDESITAVAGLYNTAGMCEVTVTDNQSPYKSSLSMSPGPCKRHKKKVDDMEHISNRTKTDDDDGHINGAKYHVQETSSSASQAVEEDEFDAFGRSMASQLRKLSLPRALRIQSKFQTMLSEERICDMQLNSHTVHNDSTHTDSQVVVYWQK